jgi:hypothetical protein
MGSIHDWLREDPDARTPEAREITLVGVIGWIAAIVIAANLAFLAQRLLG